MESLYLLIPIALLFCAIAIKLLLWAIDSGQYDDLDKEAWKILADDEPAGNDSAPPQQDNEGRQQ
ncbi:MAG: cbb3-type cytochrome oxidase assembly protein CcoS [Halieaceae bacterium]|nr:cbb3-type cytochrome oxidase assembly protein CcoS [Halieaceae bacterium]MCP5205077.1 cbb3-type cytochrome oxidase assembly protein CcoS [Pseudomonadales bacterium]